jgi:hypothetical protein
MSLVAVENERWITATNQIAMLVEELPNSTFVARLPASIFDRFRILEPCAEPLSLSSPIEIDAKVPPGSALSLMKTTADGIKMENNAEQS